MLLLVTFVTLLTILETQAHPLSHEYKEKIFSYHTYCLAESGVEEKIVLKFGKDYPVDDQKLKNYSLCLSKKLGLQNEDGQIKREVIKENLLQHNHNTTVSDELVEKCAIQKESDVETAFSMFKCFCENDLGQILYIISLTPEKTRKLVKYHKQCVEQTKIDEDLIKRAHEGNYSDDPTLKTFLLCFAKKLRFLDAEGKLQKSVITQKLTDAVKNTEYVENLVGVCALEKDTSEDTAYALLKCIDEKSFITLLPPISLSPEKALKLFTYHKECEKQTAVDKILVIEASLGNFTEDDKLKEYLLCMNKKAGFQNSEGILQKDVLLEKIGEVFNDSVVSEMLVEKCGVQGDTATNTAYNVVKCYYENSPNHTTIFQEFALSARQKEKLSKYNAECLTESTVDAEIIQQVKEGNFPDDEKLKNHIFCISKKLRLQNDAGEFQSKKLLCKFGQLLGDPALAEKLVEKCSVQMDTPTDTAYKAFVCYYENTPSNFNLFTHI